MANTRPKDFVTTRTWPAADDYLGLDGAAGGTAKFLASNIYGVIGADIASAATVDLSTVTGDFIDVTGTTTITSFGTGIPGRKVWIRFTGILVLTHSANLFLPNVQNLTTAANDIGCFVALSSSVWWCLHYKRQGSAPLLFATNGQVQTGTSGVTVVSPATLKPLESMVFAVTGETTVAAIAGPPHLTFRMPYAFKIAPAGARLSVRSAAAGATKLTVDILASAVSIFSTLLTLDAGELTSTTALVPAVITNFDLTDDQAMSISITAVGNTTPGTGVKVTLIGNRV